MLACLFHCLLLSPKDLTNSVFQNFYSDTTLSKPKKIVHEPASCAPVCSDPSSFKTAKKTLLNKETIKDLSNQEIVNLVLNNQLKDHELEKRLDPFRAVTIRRMACNVKLASVTGKNSVLQNLPESPSLDYSKVFGANCEIVVGYLPLPVGLVGPLTLNLSLIHI